MNNNRLSTAVADSDEIRDQVISAGLFPRGTQGVYRNGHSASVTMFKPICAQLRRCKKENLEPVIELAVEIGARRAGGSAR